MWLGDMIFVVGRWNVFELLFWSRAFEGAKFFGYEIVQAWPDAIVEFNSQASYAHRTHILDKQMQLLISVFVHTLFELNYASECHSPYDQIQAVHSLVSPCTSCCHVQRLKGDEKKEKNR
jgi:hypothetical protein